MLLALSKRIEILSRPSRQKNNTTVAAGSSINLFPHEACSLGKNQYYCSSSFEHQCRPSQHMQIRQKNNTTTVTANRFEHQRRVMNHMETTCWAPMLSSVLFRITGKKKTWAIVEQSCNFTTTVHTIAAHNLHKLQKLSNVLPISKPVSIKTKHPHREASEHLYPFSTFRKSSECLSSLVAYNILFHIRHLDRERETYIHTHTHISQRTNPKYKNNDSSCVKTERIKIEFLTECQRAFSSNCMLRELGEGDEENVEDDMKQLLQARCIMRSSQECFYREFFREIDFATRNILEIAEKCKHNNNIKTQRFKHNFGPGR